MVVFIGGVSAEPVRSSAGSGQPDRPALWAILLAFPVAMALATGVEASSTVIAQLGQLDNDGRKRFGHLSLLGTLLIVGSLTVGFTILAVRLTIGLPLGQSTLTGDSTGERQRVFVCCLSGCHGLAAGRSEFLGVPGRPRAAKSSGAGEGRG
ncbi:MAG: hypothetical protein JOZ19_00485 [Rubrobacter sp.]|nr:hypothetical protein [Rubrobacter sp.]